MSAVKFDGSNVNFVIKKLTGQLITKSEESELIPMEADIISIVDLSGSMRVCYGIDSSCCYDDLEGIYWGSNNCYGITKDKGDD